MRDVEDDVVVSQSETEIVSRSGRRVTKTIEKCQVTRHDTERYSGELREQEKQQQC